MSEIYPKITTIIPTYRRPDMLRRAIKSVLNQTYPHFQVCVYDNASGDETAQVVAELSKKDPRITYYCHPKNMGAFVNFDYGMKHVETPFFSILADDDILLPDFYKTAMAGFEQYPNAFFSILATIVMDSNCNIIDMSPDINLKPGFYQAPNGLVEMFGCTAPVWTGIVWRREVTEKIGFLDSEIGLISDGDFTLRAAARFSFVVSPTVGSIFVSHKNCCCNNAKLHDVWPGWNKCIRKITENEQLPPDVRLLAEHVLTKHLKRKLFYIGIGEILRRNSIDQYEVATIFREYYQEKTKANLLYILSKICNYFPPVYYAVLLSNNVRKYMIRRLSRMRKQTAAELLCIDIMNKSREY